MMRDRRVMRVMASGVMLGTALVAYGCADRADPLAPSASPRLEARDKAGGAPSGKRSVFVLQRATPLEQRIAVTQIIDQAGGSLAIPEAGLRLVFPVGAVSEPVAITATALAGGMVAYTFGPHGLQFGAPVVLEQDLRATAAKTNRALLSDLQGGYFADEGTDLDPVAGAATVSELYPVQYDADKTKLAFTIRHFSGYLTASNKKDTVTVTVSVPKGK